MNLIKKYIIAIIILIIPTFVFLLRPGVYWNMHDDMQIIRQLEIEKCLLDGQVPCRWTPDLGYGYGYPLFNFYPPLPYIVGEVFRFFGFSFVATIKLTAILQIISSTLAMFVLGSSLFGLFGGSISAIFYAYAPYRAVNIYVRGAMNEAWASVFFPLIFYFSRKIIVDNKNREKNILFLSFSIFGLLLSHNPMALTFIPFVGIWCIYWLYKTNNVTQKILYLVYSAVYALCLSAFYTIPVLIESKYVQIESMFVNYYHYSVHFVSIYQLFLSNFWGDGPSVWGTNDGMPFMIGYIHWIVPILLIIYSVYIFYKKTNLETAEITIILGILGFFAALMTHQKSGILWQYITPIQKIQFPWRFLSHSSFLLAVTSGALGVFFKEKKWIVVCIIVLMFALNLSHFTPITSGPITDNQKMSGLAWQNQITSGIYDYLPKTASTAAKQPAKLFIDEISPVNTKYQLTGEKKGTDWQFFNINTESTSTITLPILAFPNFIVTDFGQEIKTKIEPVLGRITIDLTPGNHQIYIKLHNTPIRSISNFISFCAWTISIAYFVFYLWKNKKLKK